MAVARIRKPARTWLLAPVLGFLLSPVPVARASVPRTITLEVTPNPVAYGDMITLAGRVDTVGGPEACESDVEVGFFFDEADDAGFGGPPHISWFEMRGRTAEDGTFSFSQDLPRPGAFWAGVAEDEANGCDAAISERVGVGVRHLVVLRAKDATVRKGGVARLRARVWPFCGYTYSEKRGIGPGKIFLEEMRGGSFTRVAGTPVEDRPFRRCHVVFHQRISRSTVFRAMTPPRTGGLCCFFMRGWSEPVTIEVRG